MTEDLRARARAVFARRPHWTVQAQVIGEAERQPALISTWGFPSVQAWAEAELDLSGQGYVELARLGQAVARSGLPVASWAEVPRGRAKAILRVLGLGGDARVWVGRALSLGSEDWAATVLRALGKDEGWRLREIRLPESVDQALDAAMERAAEALGINPAWRWSKDYAHLCLDVILAESAAA